jgi:putative hydrolase of the HAD superfamily
MLVSSLPTTEISATGLSTRNGLLKNEGYRLGVITNGESKGQREKISALQIEHYLDGIVTSGDIGVKKPAAHIYQVALNKLDCEPHEAIYVGDHPINDYVGSSAVGITPIWFRGFVEWTSELERPMNIVSDLAAVVNELRKIANRSSEEPEASTYFSAD